MVSDWRGPDFTPVLDNRHLIIHDTFVTLLNSNLVQLTNKLCRMEEEFVYIRRELDKRE